MPRAAPIPQTFSVPCSALQARGYCVSVAQEAVTTLEAGLGFFGRASIAFAALETLLAVAADRIEALAIDPRGLWLPDELDDERAQIQARIDTLTRQRPEQRGPLAAVDLRYDAADAAQRAEYARLAYCSALATVWSKRRTTTYFEASDHGSAKYWLPESIKVQYFERLVADGWEVPEEWVGAVAKQPKAWWKRRLS